MEQVKVSSKGQIAIPKEVREALNLSAGSTLTLKVQGQRIILSKEPAWKGLRGMLKDVPDLMESFAEFKKQERELEDSRS